MYFFTDFRFSLIRWFLNGIFWLFLKAKTLIYGFYHQNIIKIRNLEIKLSSWWASSTLTHAFLFSKKRDLRIRNPWFFSGRNFFENNMKDLVKFDLLTIFYQFRYSVMARNLLGSKVRRNFSYCFIKSCDQTKIRDS